MILFISGFLWGAGFIVGMGIICRILSLVSEIKSGKEAKKNLFRNNQELLKLFNTSPMLGFLTPEQESIFDKDTSSIAFFEKVPEDFADRYELNLRKK